MPKLTFTSSGYKKLKKEYEKLTKEKRPAALEALREARGMGSLEDNLQYDETKSALETIDGRIAELQKLLSQGQVVENSKGEIISVGSQVTVELEGEAQVYIIVNPYESDPVAGKISYESPVGQSLLKKKVGEKVAVNLPHATLEYVIIEVK